VAVSRKDLGNDRFGTHDVDRKIAPVGKVVDAGRLVDETDIERERASPEVEGTDWNRKGVDQSEGGRWLAGPRADDQQGCPRQGYDTFPDFAAQSIVRLEHFVLPSCECFKSVYRPTGTSDADKESRRFHLKRLILSEHTDISLWLHFQKIGIL
jgi:hypothetical protein